MCGIIGYFGKDAFTHVTAGLHRMQERGRDGAGYYDGKLLVHGKTIEGLSFSSSEQIIGHVLHAIVDCVLEPLQTSVSCFVMNGEIYNWKELAKKYSVTADNDAQLLHALLDAKGLDALEDVRGVYALAYWKGDEIFLARDIVGIKPLWYQLEGFAFASEKKALCSSSAFELNPRQILVYDTAKKTISYRSRVFFPLEPLVDASKLHELLTHSVALRIPLQKFGLLFSGGLDSVLIAKMLKDAGHVFTCYTAGTSEDAPDLIAAKKAAQVIGLDLKYTIVPKEDVPDMLSVLVPLIEDTNVVKVGVALPLFVACKLAREDGCRVIFSGSGADELFGGYHRYKESSLDQLNKDCYSDVLKLYEKNSYRDDVITMNSNLELRVPFLDKEVVSYALRIDPLLKIKEGQEKWVLRRLALDIGIPEEFSMRKKKAAQYGSGFDKALSLLSGRKKSTYLRQFYPQANLRLGAMISSGKDGLYAAWTMMKQNYDVACFITLESENPDSFMFHTPNVSLARLQAQAASVPIIVGFTSGEKEKELDDLMRVLKEAKEKYNLDGIITGALYSNYQRTRIERVADSLGLKIFSPLWHIDQEQEMRQLISEGFVFWFSSVAAEGLDASWLGRQITAADVDRLVALNKKVGLNVAGEGGEYESLVLDCPLFSRKIVVGEYAVIKDETSARIHITQAHNVDKK